MGRSTQHRTGRSKRRASAPGVGETGALLPMLTAWLVGAALVARLLVPAESAADGDTLWLVQVWLGAGLLWGWNCFRERSTRIRFDAADAAVGLLVVGHVVSALLVVAGEGDKRAALNMLWEWIGLGISWFLIRQTVRTTHAARGLTAVMIVTAGVMAGVGVWQHFVFYPRAAREYEVVRSELDNQLERGIPDPARAHELRRKLLQSGVPPDALEGPSRIAFEQRLQSSSEPFGAFALANTFAGWLAAWLLPAAAAVVALQRRGGFSSRSVAAAAFVASIMYCLLLTKSRTAWAGVLVGLLTWAALELRRHTRWRRTIVAGTAIASVAVALSLTAAVLTRGVDFEVVSEAPKSLSYRLQYWTASWRVIQSHPVWGVGPGNFRQHYLKEKLPESSEEIADPHNFVLGLWANAGIVPLVGMLWLIVLFVRRTLQRPSDVADLTPSADREEQHRLQSLVIGAACSFGLVFVYGVLLGSGANLLLPVWFAAWLACWLVVGRALARLPFHSASLVAAAVALLVHLLGAGGIEMPAVVQTLLLLLILAELLATAENTAGLFRERPWCTWAVAGAMPVLFVTCLLTATGPVLHRRALVDAADAAWLERGDSSRAARLLAEAAERDPLSPDPPRRLAQLSFVRWQSSPDSSESEFNRGVELAKLAIEKDPHSSAGYRLLAQWQLARFRRVGEVRYAEEAARSFERAVERYPHNAALRAEFAEAQWRAGNEADARREADAALSLEAINRRAGHRDKYLPSETVKLLQKVADDAGRSHGRPIRD